MTKQACSQTGLLLEANAVVSRSIVASGLLPVQTVSQSSYLRGTGTGCFQLFSQTTVSGFALICSLICCSWCSHEDSETCHCWADGKGSRGSSEGPVSSHRQVPSVCFAMRKMDIKIVHTLPKLLHSKVLVIDRRGRSMRALIAQLN